MVDVMLIHPNVNGGNPVLFPSVKVGYKWDNLTSAEAAEGLFDFTEVNYGGFANPIITIDGFIDLEDSRSNVVTQKFLVDFATLRSTTPIKLIVPCPYSSGTAYLGGRPTSGFSSSGDNTLSGTINCWIQNFTIEIASDSENLWKYTLTLIETRE